MVSTSWNYNYKGARTFESGLGMPRGYMASVEDALEQPTKSSIRTKTSRIRMDVISPPPPPPHPPPRPHRTTKQHKKMKKTKRKNTSHTSHDRTAPPNSTRRFRKITAHRKERELQVEAGMCRKSRDGPNTAKNDGNATDTENTEKHDAKG